MQLLCWPLAIAAGCTDGRMVIIQGSKGFLGVITAKMLCLQKRVFYLDALKHFKCILPQSTLQICWGGVLSVRAAWHQGVGQGPQRVSQAPLIEHLTAPGRPLGEGTDLSTVPWLCVC